MQKVLHLCWRLTKEIAHRVQYPLKNRFLVLAGDTFVKECEGLRVKLEASVASALFTWPDIKKKQHRRLIAGYLLLYDIAVFLLFLF
jgi:hypothetical protein